LKKATAIKFIIAFLPFCSFFFSPFLEMLLVFEKLENRRKIRNKKKKKVFKKIILVGNA